MRMHGKLVLAAAVLAATAGVAIAQTAVTRHTVPKSADGSLVVALCDGKTTMAIPGKHEGDSLTRTEAQSVSEKLMAEWRRKNPHARWDEQTLLAENTAPAPSSSGGAARSAIPPAPAAGAEGHQVLPSSATKPLQAQVYGGYTERDEQIWMASTQDFIERGKKVFHDASELGGTIGVSCDMCHPNAANTHPESYPKYQVQLGRVALLRDMINWCIENPVRGKPLADDDPKLKAIEAYILAQRKGVPLDYGKH